MSLQFVIDMNLSPDWVSVFKNSGWHAVHWSSVGAPSCPDHEIMAWAQSNGYVVFTHDLDFGSILAVTGASGPSVIQVRAQDVFPGHLGPTMIAAVRQYESLLVQGALIVIDERTCRARVLPLR